MWVHDRDPGDFSDSLFQVFVVCRDNVTSVLRDAIAETVVGIRAFVRARKPLEELVLGCS